MTIVQRSQRGIRNLQCVLKNKVRVVTKAVFFGIPTTHGDETNLKLGRYLKTGVGDLVETATPKSELTLDKEELENLVEFISQNYKPIQDGANHYVSLDGFEANPREVESLKGIFANPDQKRVLDFITGNGILPEELLLALEIKKKKAAIECFERMLTEDLNENSWQTWFAENCWVLGTEFVRVLDERDIDTANITDYLMQAYDGFLDIVEIKRPETGQDFWASSQDHGNYIPSSHLVKAVTQASKYIYAVERQSNSVEFLERVDDVKTIKPRCVLIFGRSHDWNEGQKEAYRILNATYHNISILTYDHVLDRARKIAGLENTQEPVAEDQSELEDPSWNLDEPPF